MDKRLKELAAELGRMGGKARAKKLTAEQRSDEARKAVQARWKKYREANKTTKGKSK